MEDELIACRAALEKARSRIAELEEECHARRQPVSAPHMTAAPESPTGILCPAPILLHDRATPLAAAATSNALQWLRLLRSAQARTTQGCIELQGAANRFVSSGESFAGSLRDLAAVYAAVDAATASDAGAAAAAASSSGSSSSSIAAGAGMLAELLTEVCSFSANLASSLDAVFVSRVGGDASASFGQCMAAAKSAGVACEASLAAQDRLVRLRKGSTPPAVLSCTDDAVKSCLVQERSRLDASTAINSAEVRSRIALGQAISGAMFSLHAYFRQCDASAAFHEKRMDAFARSIEDSRAEAVRRDATWRSGRDQLDTLLARVTAPSLGTVAELGPAAPTESSSSSLSVMSTVVQRATMPLDAAEEAVRRTAFAIAARLGTPGGDGGASGVPALCWPGLTPAPSRHLGSSSARGALSGLLGGAVLGGWLWRFDPKRRLGSAWRRQWCFIAEGKLCSIGSTEGEGADGQPLDGGIEAHVTNSSYSGALGSIAGAAYALATSSTAALHGYAINEDDRPLPPQPLLRRLDVRLLAELVTANIRYSALPSNVATSAPRRPRQLHAGGGASLRAPAAAPAPQSRGFLLRAVAAASSYIRSGSSGSSGGVQVVGGSAAQRSRRSSGGNVPMGGGQPIPVMGGGYPIPQALLLEQQAPPMLPAATAADAGPEAPHAAGDVETGDADFDDDPLDDDAELLVVEAPLATAPTHLAAAAVDSGAAVLHARGGAGHASHHTSTHATPLDAPPALPASFAVLHAFELRAPHETLIFATTTAAQRRTWVETLKRLAESELTHSGGGSSTRGAGQLPGSATASQLTADGTRTLAAALEKFEPGATTSAAAAAILAANAACSDCGAPSPDWVSLNLGCVFCLDCSGVHRSLGAHVSRVRSLVLDSLEPFALAALLLLGNAVSGAIFEDPSEQERTNVHKPLPTATRADRDRFIRSKYSELSFVQRDGPPARAVLINASARLGALAAGVGEERGDAALASLFSAASHEGHLPLVLWCLVRRAKAALNAPPAGSEADADTSAAGNRISVATLPLHEAVLSKHWACAYLLLSFSGWEPPGDPDTAGRSIWQAAVQAVSESLLATRCVASPAATDAVATCEPLVSALASLFVRTPDRRVALSSAMETLRVIVRESAGAEGPV